MSELIPVNLTLGEWRARLNSSFLDYNETTGSAQIKSAAVADKLTTARTIALTGDVIGTMSFDGTTNLSVPTSFNTVPTNATLGTIKLSNSTVLLNQQLIPTKLSLVRSDVESPYISNDGSNILIDGTTTDTITLTTSKSISISGSSISLGATTGSITLVQNGLNLGTSSVKFGTIYATTFNGNATSASTSAKLTTARNISLSGGATGTATAFNGTADIAIPVTALDATVLTGTIALNSTGNAATATALETARTIRTNLASTATASFNGTANITPGVTGVLPVANGGTGNTSNLAATATALANARNITLTGAITGTAPFDGTANATIATTNATGVLLTGDQAISGVKTFSTQVDKVQALGTQSTHINIDLSKGTSLSFTIAAGTGVDFDLTNVPAGGCTVKLLITNGGAYTVGWATTVKWAGGVAPSLTASGVDLITMYTQDAGNTWYASSVLNLK